MFDITEIDRCTFCSLREECKAIEGKEKGYCEILLKAYDKGEDNGVMIAIGIESDEDDFAERMKKRISDAAESVIDNLLEDGYRWIRRYQPEESDEEE